MSDAFEEHEFLAWLRQRVPLKDCDVPLGDDAASIRVEAGFQQLLCMDSVVQGVHAPETGDVMDVLARKVVRCNVSDMAAMGGFPTHALLSMTLSPDCTGDEARHLMDVVLEECQRFDISLCGGDTVIGKGQVVLTLALTGAPFKEPVRRSGAKPGDVLVVTGDLGGSILGRHSEFEPRLREARALVELGPPNAMTDISDGLGRDLLNVCDQSCCGVELKADLIPISNDAILCSQESGRSPLQHALTDGEDFELLATFPRDVFQSLVGEWELDTKITVIGEMVESGCWLVGKEGKEALKPHGWSHAASLESRDVS